MSLETLQILDRWFEAHPRFISMHHVDSFDSFVSDMMQPLISSMNDSFGVRHVHGGVTYTVDVEVGERYLDRPLLPGQNSPLYPNNARLLNLTYATNIYVDIKCVYKQAGAVAGTRTFRQVHIGSMPIMLHSRMCYLRDRTQQELRDLGECVFDQGGYFVVDGKEKVVIAQERIAFNKLFVTQHNSGPFSHEAFIRCVSEMDAFPKTLRLFVRAGPLRRNAVLCSLPHMTAPLPLFVFFRCLGVESDQEILDFVSPSGQVRDFLRASVIDGSTCYERACAIELMRKSLKLRGTDNIEVVLRADLLPNAGPDFRARARFLGYLVDQVAQVCTGLRQPTNRDSWVHKRMDLSGFMLADLFRDFYRRFRSKAMAFLKIEMTSGVWSTREGGITELVTPNNVARIFDRSIIERGITRSFKGRWNYDEYNPEASTEYARKGVVQDLGRVSYQAYMSHIRRVSTVMGTGAGKVKLPGPHKLYAAQWGAVCPVETPDGPNVGLLKHFSIACHVTSDRDTARLVSHLEALQLITDKRVREGDGENEARPTRVFVNYNLAGYAKTPEALVAYLRALRGAGYVAPDVSVSWDVFRAEVQILADRGRTCRPLLRANAGTGGGGDAGEGAPPWSSLLKGSGVEFPPGTECLAQDLGDSAQSADEVAAVTERLTARSAPIALVDTEELGNVLVGDGARCTHRELHPALMFSPNVASIPLMERNPAAYNVFAIAQMKQGVGVYATNFLNRADNAGMVLESPQLPLVTTYFADRVCDGRFMHGQNLVLGIVTCTGYNQEDAVILNRASVERGMMRVTSLHTVVASEERNPTGDLLFSTAAATSTNLQGNGMPRIGMRVTANDQPLVGMALFPAANRDDPDTAPKPVNATVTAGEHGLGVVDRVWIADARPGERTCKVRVRGTREPDVGDKVASRYGQKGVVGLLMDPNDMPFGHDGTALDILINPNGFPKRMTVAHILEALLGKAACVSGTRVEANAFENSDVPRAARDFLRGSGFSPTGGMVLREGRSGRQLDANVFVGLNYYNRLKHMVVDKINTRSTGPRNAITRQPTHGRNNNGGLRIGEMETQGLVAHGAACFLKESFIERADAFPVNVDEITGLWSTHGSTSGEIVGGAPATKVPFSFNQLSKELEAMSIGMILDLDSTHHRPLAGMLGGSKRPH